MKLSDIFYDDAWICDPKKCPSCPKTICHGGNCYHTTVKEERARGIKRFIFFLQFLIFGTPSWEFKYGWRNGKRRHNKQNLERFVGQPITDAQWELFKKVSDAVDKCPPDCEVKWRCRTNRQGIMYYYPEYVKKEVKD